MMAWLRLAVFVGLALVLCGPSMAQTRKETLADIRQELSVLYVDIQRLKTELSTTGSTGSVGTAGDSTLQRIDALEGEVRRITGKVEEMEFRVEKIVRDGTNRIGDLEFRLVELEGGDVSKLGETSTLGGADILPANPTPVVVTPVQPSGNAELAISEQSDFDAAKAAFDGGDNQQAADLFQTYLDNYPGGVLTPDANFWRGEALAGISEWSKAARAYLQAFSSAPDGPLAPRSLYRLGVSLDRIGQRNEACLTLAEVGVRYPGSDAQRDADRDLISMNCNN
jgi:tol-pal system protein YbgF